VPRQLVILLGFLAVSCAPQVKETPVTENQYPVPKKKAPAPSASVQSLPVRSAPEPTASAEAPRAFEVSLQGISITGVSFDSRTHRLAVADQPGGPGANWPDAKSAGSSFGGVAAVNAGFFTPEGAPLGLLVSKGKKTGVINRSSSLGAGFYADGSLLRRENWSGNAAEALQSGPFLIDRGKTVGGLSDVTSSARTFIGWDGGTRWFLARSGSCSLASLARALEGSYPGGVRSHTVLNLDGGRSSDLWISSSVQGGPVTERPLWNKPVRNFLVLLPRP
jgi:hypothetical protein